MNRFTRWIRRQPPLEVVTAAVAIVLAVISLAAIAIQMQDEGEAGRDNSQLTDIGEEPGVPGVIPPEGSATETVVADEPLSDEPPGASPTPGPPVVATFPPISQSAIVSLSIATAVVEATSFEAAGLGPDGTLALPTDPDVVLYYDFGARLGDTAGNVVIGGDTFRTPEVESALANLGAVRTGDRIVIEVADGTVYVYQVFAITALTDRPATLENVGCTADGCDGLGTLTLLGYRESGTLIVQAQLLRGSR